MAGIYLHIPFCKKACHYCDFHFSTSLRNKKELLITLKQEIQLRKSYLEGQNVETIYFGGGTPSLLRANEITCLLDHIHRYFIVSDKVEITLEANPDDLTTQKVQALCKTAINRFSIGIQSFFDEDLRWMNRTHTAAEAEIGIQRVQDAGFENINIDLIYGYPLLSDEKWLSNIQKVIALQIPHISAYSITVEPRTALDAFIKKKKQPPMDEEQSSRQFLKLLQLLKAVGIEQYEISNFAKLGKHSRHNTNYWKGVWYLGIGPSAHSYNGKSRQWNIANNSTYIQSINQGQIPAEKEILSKKDQFNEYILSSLRTSWGIELQKIKIDFGDDYALYTKNTAGSFIAKEWLIMNDYCIILTTEGKLFSDTITTAFFCT